MKNETILNQVGNTELISLPTFGKHLFAKLEKTNPAGSIKDRTVKNMLLDYFEKGTLHEGDTVIEPTSGNTGIALACLGKEAFGLTVKIVMPESASIQRRELIASYGAELVLVSGGMAECIAKAKELRAQIKGSVIFGQFENLANPEAHYKTTGPEILSQCPEVDVIVAGIGTGGTISGLGKFFKEHKPSVEIIGVEPASSPLLTQGKAGPHKIQGIGANFVPNTYLPQYVDKVVTVKDEDAIELARLVNAKEGYFVGISSGAAMSASLELSKLEAYKDKNIVMIFPDGGERYSW